MDQVSKKMPTPNRKVCPVFGKSCE